MAAPSPSLYEATLLAERALCLASLEAHIEIACQKVFDENVHGDIIETLDRGDFEEIIIMLPRGHFKSTLLACYISWRIALDPNFTALLVGAVHSTAADTVFMVRELLESEHMARIYGRAFKGDSVWNNEELIVAGRTTVMRESTLKAMGMESFKPGGHFDFVLFDDVEDQDTVNTADLRAKTRRNDALAWPMADKAGSKRGTTGTFYDDNDLYCHKIEGYGLGKVDEMAGMLVCENGARSADGKAVLFFKIAWDEEENPIMPQHFPKERLKRLQSRMEFEDPGSFDKHYLLNPVTNKSARFKKEDYITASSAPVGLEVSFGYDFAQSKTEGSDRSGIVGAFHSPDYMFYIFEATELAIDAEAQQNAIFERAQAFPHSRHYVEADNFVKGWRPHFETRCRQMGAFPIVEWIDAGARTKKDDRIFATESLFRMKLVRFLPGASYLWSQLSRMPASRRKDVADAWANIVQFVVASLLVATDPNAKKEVKGWEKLLHNGPGVPPWQDGEATSDQPYAGKKGSDVPWMAS